MKRTIALSTVGVLALSGAGAAGALARQSAAGTRADAVAAAKTLLADSPVISGSTSVATRPSHRLTTPDRGYTKLVTRTAYWTVKENPRAALHALEGSAGSGLTFGGDGWSGSIHKPASREYQADWSLTTTPAGIYYDNLQLEIVRIGHGSSGIAAYAQAVAIPKRSAAELVPVEGTKVHVAVRRNNDHTVRRAAVTGTARAKLINSFNGLEVIPAGAPPVPCPLDRGGRLLVTFSAASGGTLKALSGFCGFVDVTQGSRSLRTLQDGGSYDSDIRHDLAPKASA